MEDPSELLVLEDRIGSVEAGVLYSWYDFTTGEPIGIMTLEQIEIYCTGRPVESSEDDWRRDISDL